MSTTPATMFLGDLDDPWVAAIAARLPQSATRVCVAGDLPERWPASPQSFSTIVVHRRYLGEQDALRLKRLRKDDWPNARVILCHGPFDRYAVLQKASTLVDALLSEAIAADVIGRYVDSPRSATPGTESRPNVAVVSKSYELREALADGCRARGFASFGTGNWSEVPNRAVAVWDAPTLETDWPAQLRSASRMRMVVALLAFADRSLVQQARSHGASACLDSPCDLDDLAHVLGRVAQSRRSERAHESYPTPNAIGERVRAPSRPGRSRPA